MKTYLEPSASRLLHLHLQIIDASFHGQNIITHASCNHGRAEVEGLRGVRRNCELYIFRQ